MIKYKKTPEKIGSIRASFRKWFSNLNAPTKAYIDEPRPVDDARRASLANYTP
jgi:hypothetical protein